jgi:MFS family permease
MSETFSAGDPVIRSGVPGPPPVGRAFVGLYALAYLGTNLVFLAPVLVTLALKVNALVGIERAPAALGMVTGIGSLLALVANPFFGRMSDRTTSRLGMRRPWMVAGLLGGSVGILTVALATSIPVVLIGWCLTQLMFNALLAAVVAVLPDRVPTVQRGMVSGILGICLPVASVCATFLVQLFAGQLLVMFLAPCAIGGLCILVFAFLFDDRRLDPSAKPRWSAREFATTFYVNPRRSPDFSWAFLSRFLLLMGYAFLTTYQTYYLLQRLGSSEVEVPRQVYLGTLLQAVGIIVASLVGGRLSDRTGRRKAFVVAAAIIYAAAMFVIAAARTFDGYLVGMAVGGLGFGLYLAVDLALVADVVSPRDHGKDLGVFNIANALPFSIAPAVAPLILAVTDGNYGVLYAVAGGCALLGAAAIMPVRRVR